MSVRLIILLPLLLSSCTGLNSIYYQGHQVAQAIGVAPLSKIERNERWVLPRDTRFYLAKNNVLSEYSGDNAIALSRLVERSMSQHFGLIRQGLYPESLENSLASAQMAGSQFVVYPRILRWDNKHGTWSEIFYALRNDSNEDIVAGFGLDRAAVQIIIIDVSSGEMMDFVQVEAGSGLFGLYGDTPDSLISSALSSYFAQIALVKG